MAEVTENEALEADSRWKLPTLLCFVQTEVDKNAGSFFEVFKKLNFTCESHPKFGLNFEFL